MSQTNDALIEIVHVTDPTSITATWADVPGSCVEYSTDISAITATEADTVMGDYVSATRQTAGLSQSSLAEDINTASTCLFQNFDSTNSQLFVVYATSLSATASIRCGLEWIEYL